MIERGPLKSLPECKLPFKTTHFVVGDNFAAQCPSEEAALHMKEYIEAKTGNKLKVVRND